ncbi:hypothetical protein PPYR_07070 [Photinus pyralis]|uniref:Ubiquitin-like protein ATG12 n=1 Tax=Photinus pyralis TaxID=7054 RepID=A0A1Y1JX77_PHOPY|nr:autophagy protein 12-like [Photinus pyralis]KAB0799190.1 hypothetical protein PPYR_07070 [Photinus pyralis]
MSGTENEPESDFNESTNSTLHNVSQALDSDFDSLKKTDKQKIDILLKPTGNAPIMKRRKWAVDAEKPLGWIVEFVKKYLKLEAHERVFLYVNQTFAPSPDQIVKNLYDCYNTDGKLILHYCKTQAWG